MEQQSPGTEGAKDPVGRNLERLNRVFSPMRQKIEREAQEALSEIERKINEISDILYRYNITEPLDGMFFNELIFHLEMHMLTKQPEADYYEQERLFVQKCREELAARRARGL